MTIVNTLQRLIGMWAYTMLFVQIILGSFMPRLAEKFGGWIFKFHVFEGILVYFLILLHPALFIVFNYLVGRGLDPFYVFIDACLICRNSIESSYSYGRIAFWLLTIGVFAGLFRMTTPFLRIHWKKFHILNYFAFIFVWFHSLKLGSDVGTFPFSFVHGSMVVVVLAIVFYRLYLYIKKQPVSK